MAEVKMPEKTEDVSQVERTSLDIPSNSDKSLQQKEHVQRVSRVTKGDARRKKESTGAKLKAAIFGEDVVDVKDYMIFDVMIPALKATISDMIGNGINVLLFGEPRRKSKGESNRVSYASYYKSDRDRDNDRRSVNRHRSAFDFDDIVLDSRGEAEEVISQLQDLAFDYGQATVADLYDLVGISGSFTDDRWGWFKGDLRTAGVRRIRDGYLLELPKPARLD